jgi:hypothetical protein
MYLLQDDRIRPSASASSVVLAALLIALTGCASELSPEEIADLEAEGPYVGEGEVASTTQALTGVPASTGYLWANDSARETPYQPAASYSFNSEGEANTVDRQQEHGAGRYRVFMEGLSAPGNVQVTAYGNNAHRCNLRSAAVNSNGGVRFDVNCFTAQGVPVNSQFVVFYNNTGETNGELSMASVSASAGISDFANVWTAIKRSTGRYRIFVQGAINQTSGVPFATARGSNPSFCHPSQVAIDLDYGTWFVDVDCFNMEGQRADTPFQFTYMTIPNFTQIESAVALSESTSDNFPGGHYSSTNSRRVVHFDYTDPTSLDVGVFWTGVSTQTTSLVSAFTSSAVSCKPRIWDPTSGDHFSTSVVCHNVLGEARKVRVSNGFFGVP